MSRLGKFLDKLEEQRDDVAKKYMRENYSILLTVSSIDLDFTEKYRFWTILLMIYNYAVLINQDWMLWYSWYLLKDDFDAASGVGNYSCLVLLSLVFVVDFTYYRTTVLNLFKSAALGIYEYPEPLKDTPDMVEFRGFLKSHYRMLMILAAYVCWIGILAVLGPFIDDKLGLGFEEVYDENGVNRQLPVPLFFPFETTDWFGYIVAMAMTTLSGCATCAIIGGVSLVFTTSCQFFLLELKKLCCSLKAISHRARKKYCKKHGIAEKSLNRREIYRIPEFQKCIGECIKENIKHHHAIRICFEGYQTIAKPILLSCFSIVTLAIGLSLIKLNEDVTRPGSSIAFASVALGELFNIFNMCMCGELLISLSQELNSEVYFTPWYNFNVENRKLINQFLLGTRAPLTLGAFIGRIDMEMFASMMNTAYSFFNFIKLSDNIHLD